MRLADGVGDLDLAAGGETRGDDVLRDPAHRVGGGTVDLGRVLAAEGAATVAGHAAVGVDDDLAAGQAGVAHRAADLEATGRVDQQAVAVGLQAELGELGLDHVLPDVRGQQRVDVDVGRVLARDDDGVEPGRLAVDVLDGHLGLAVRPEVADDPSLRTRDSPNARRCASAIGSGISSGVSSQAKPNIRPWSPAP